MSRRLAREAAMCLLYEKEILGQAPDTDTLKEMCDILHTDEFLDRQGEYIESVMEADREHREAVDMQIEKYSHAWKLGRLSRVDISILRLAVIELLYLENIPSKVVLNEAVELAKKFSGEKSPAFINGVLASVLKETDLPKD